MSNKFSQELEQITGMPDSYPEPLLLFEKFAGYGGASFTLKNAGIPFECVGYSEIDKYAIQCYEQNHGDIKNFGDCTKINPEDLIRVVVKVDVPDLHTMEFKARIVREHKRDRLHEFGMEILEIDDENRDVLDKLLYKLEKNEKLLVMDYLK